jgi:SAM-dependent methyltransferase
VNRAIAYSFAIAIETVTSSTVPLRCPTCRSAVTVGAEAACENGHTFSVEDGIVDFIGHPAHDAEYVACDACCEGAGMERRTDNYIIPWLRSDGSKLGEIRLLEDGCGCGDTVQRLAAAGVDAYGVDPGRRNQHWGSLDIPGRLFVADGMKLPFADCSFDVVTSSGVLEHVGEGLDLPRRAQKPHKQLYIQEAIRVLKPGGRALIAHPNGAFPIDFWHPGRWSMRPHRLYEPWMPSAIDVRRWVSSSPIRTDVRFLPPENYLAFERVRAHLYGQIFSSAMRGLFRTIDRFPRLASTVANPWLITEITRL